MRKIGSGNMSVETARGIRTAWNNGFTCHEISKEFGIHYQTVYSVIKRKTFKYV